MNLAAKTRLVRRNKARRDRRFGLSRNVRIASGTATINTANVFGSDTARSKPLTIAFTAKRTGAANGVIFEIGSSVRGICIAADGGDLLIAAGAGAGDSDNAVSYVYADILPLNQSARVVVEIIPGNGRVRIFVNGLGPVYAQAVNESFGGAYADSGNGATSGLNGTANDLIPVGQLDALTNLTLVGGIDVFKNQTVN